MPGTKWCFRVGAHGIDEISGHHFGPSQGPSPALDLTILQDACSGFDIAATLASGNGNPAPGDSGPWVFGITARNCTGVDLIGVKVQGGSNGWAPIPKPFENNIDVDDGNFQVRDNKKNQVVTWTVDLEDGDAKTIEITVNGNISPNAPDGTILYLSGQWSAVHNNIPNGKSDYTDRVQVCVRDPNLSPGSSNCD